MSASIAHRVLRAAQESLLQISPANGYRTRPSRVDISEGPPPDLRHSPLIQLSLPSGSTMALITHDKAWEHRILLRVRIFVHAQGEGAAPGALADCAHDVARRLRKDDPTLGGIVDIMDFADPDEQGSGRVEGEAVLDFVARVITDLSD